MDPDPLALTFHLKPDAFNSPVTTAYCPAVMSLELHDLPPLNRLLFLGGPCHGCVGNESNYLLTPDDPPTAEGYTRNECITIFGTHQSVGVWHDLTTLEDVYRALFQTRFAVAFSL